MGIQNLLPALEKITVKKHLRWYRNQTAAIDAYCWLHKAKQQAYANGIRKGGLAKIVELCVAKLKLFLHNGVKPILVFDGGKLSAKEWVEEERDQRREKAKEQAVMYLQQGNHDAANKKFLESIDITPQMAHALILVLREMNIEYYVAPYEADAQLAYLYHTDYAQFVVTEDSDLLIFGVDVVFFKMDSDGYGKEVNLCRLQEVEKFKKLDKDLLMMVSIFSGCDYLQSIKGIGFQSALKFVQEAGKTDTFNKVMAKLKEFKTCKKQLKFEIPEDYEDKFKKAVLTFKH